MIDQTKLRPMNTAPHDGTSILIRFEHMNFKYAVRAGHDAEQWEAASGSALDRLQRWRRTWHGMAGTPTGWLQINSQSRATITSKPYIV